MGRFVHLQVVAPAKCAAACIAEEGFAPVVNLLMPSQVAKGGKRPAARLAFKRPLACVGAAAGADRGCHRLAAPQDPAAGGSGASTYRMCRRSSTEEPQIFAGAQNGAALTIVISQEPVLPLMF